MATKEEIIEIVEEIDENEEEEDIQDNEINISTKISEKKPKEIVTKELDQKVSAMYQELGSILKIYRTGPLPKAITILTDKNLKHWLDFLDITDPFSWSSSALYAITQHFNKYATDARLISFNQDILLQIMLDYVQKGTSGVPKNTWDACVLSSKRPIPFVKGFLLPLSEEASCTPKLSAFISAVATRIHLSSVHTNAFLIQLCESSDPTPVKTVFVARYISNGSVMAIHTIDDLVGYFVAFQTEDEEQPIIWFKGLLDFVKRYGKLTTYDQREAIDRVIEKHYHKTLSLQIRSALKKLPPPREELLPDSTEEIPSKNDKKVTFVMKDDMNYEDDNMNIEEDIIDEEEDIQEE